MDPLLQSLSGENFRRIWDLQTRKGRPLAAELHRDAPHLAFFTKPILDNISDTRSIRGLISASRKAGDPSSKRLPLRASVKERLAERDEFVDALADELGRLVAAPRFELRLERRPNIGVHEIYSSGKVDENYFASRQLQRNLKLAFRLQPANREQIIDQLVQLTDDRGA